MVISELIKELEDMKSIYGDVNVEVYATTDCGYNCGSGGIHEIVYIESKGEWEKKFHGDSYISLRNYSG